MIGEEVRNECSVIDHRKIRDSRIYPKDGIAAHQLLIRLGATQHWEKKRANGREKLRTGLLHAPLAVGTSVGTAMQQSLASVCTPRGIPCRCRGCNHKAPSTRREFGQTKGCFMHSRHTPAHRIRPPTVTNAKTHPHRRSWRSMVLNAKL